MRKTKNLLLQIKIKKPICQQPFGEIGDLGLMESWFCIWKICV